MTWIFTSQNPACYKAPSISSWLARLNGPGLPGGGGDDCARLRIIAMGIDKNGFALVDVKLSRTTHPPVRGPAESLRVAAFGLGSRAGPAANAPH